MRIKSVINAKSLSLSVVFFILISYFSPLLNIYVSRVEADGAGDLLDVVYMNEEIEQEAPGHNLEGWSEADLSGNYGGYGNDPEPESNTHYRQIMETSCTNDDRTASVTFHIGKNIPYSIEVEHLDGLADDSFDIFMGDSTISDNYIGTYYDSETTETWKINRYDFPGDPMGGDMTITFLATGDTFPYCNQYGQVAISWIKLFGENVTPPATKWLAPTAPAFFTRLNDNPLGRVNMYFEENPDTDIEYYEYQTRNCDLDGSNPGRVILNMNNYPGAVSCNTGTCYWSPGFGNGRRNIHRFRAVDNAGNTGPWSNWNDITDTDFANIDPADFTYENYLNGTGIFDSDTYEYTQENGGFAIREQISPTSTIISTEPDITYGETVNSPNITINYSAEDTDTGIKKVDLMVAKKSEIGEDYTNYCSFDTNYHSDLEPSVTGSFDLVLPMSGTYCLYTQTEDIADDLIMDEGNGNTSTPEGEYEPGNCELKITYEKTVNVTVNRRRTTDHTPELTGTISDPEASIRIALGVGGLASLSRRSTYNALNNGDGTWTLPDNTLPELPDGVYDVIAMATDSEDKTYNDSTRDELVIYTMPDDNPDPSDDGDDDNNDDNSDNNENSDDTYDNDDDNSDNEGNTPPPSIPDMIENIEDEIDIDNDEDDEEEEEKAKILGETVCEDPSKISGFVYFDENENGEKDSDEKGAAGIELQIISNDGDIVATTNTDENGYWESEVCAGDYQVKIISDLPDKSELINSGKIEINVVEGKDTGDINFKLKTKQNILEKFNYLLCLIPLVIVILAVVVYQLSTKKEK